MRKFLYRRAAALVCLLAIALAHPAVATAADYWGTRLENRPTQFIFGYGSLINSASRASTAGKAVPAIPVRVAAAFGYVRAWVSRSGTGFTALGLRKPADGEPPMTINGVLYPVENGDLLPFDQREIGYKRVEIPLSQIEAVSWQALPPDGKIWVYVPADDAGVPDSRPQIATARFPLLQTYIDVVIDGSLEYGKDFAREFIETTADWSPYWLNDREIGRRPWLYEKNYAAVDKLLAQTAPSSATYGKRVFSEEYTQYFR